MKKFIKITASFICGVLAALVVIWFVNKDMGVNVINDVDITTEQVDTVKVDTINVTLTECYDEHGC